MAGAGSPGDHPYTDIIGHNRNIFGCGVDDEIRALLHRFPASEREVIALLQAPETCAISTALSKAQRIMHQRVTDIWNGHMSAALQTRADENEA
jgi:hypothetical protein